MNGTRARSADSDNMSDDEPGVADASNRSEEDDTGGLFGSGSEGEEDGRFVSNLQDNLHGIDISFSSETGDQKRRKLDDEDLDSGDDQERLDRVDDEDGDVGMEERAETVLDVKLGRHAVPRPSDGQVSNFMHRLCC